MPNAKNATEEDVGKPKFLLLGPSGSGKTSQLLTLPGKTFAYLFDPSALSTLKGYDIEYELFMPGRVNLGAVSLSKGKSDRKTTDTSSDTYTRWEADIDKKLLPDENKYGLTERRVWVRDADTEEDSDAGHWEVLEQPACWLDQFDNIGFDSFTTFSDMVMDRILKINGRPGQFPQRDDWGGQMQTITNVVRTLVSMNKLLLFTAHEEFKQDNETSRMQNIIMLTGRLRVKLPLLFSEMLHMECASTPTEVKYQMQTRPDRLNPAIRTSFRDLEMFHDVTISDWKNPTRFGLGKLLRGSTK